jgi:hypothetical protein
MEEVEDQESPRQLSARSQLPTDPSVILEEAPDRPKKTSKVRKYPWQTVRFADPSFGSQPQKIPFTIFTSTLNVDRMVK